jgi:alanyl-tRNA synthetase
MPVAERLYYADASLRTFTARITDIREYSRTHGQSQWQVALDRTAFYPTSGGQPFDRGTLSAHARSGAELIADIDEVSEDESGEVWHSTRKPLLAGTEVTGTIDWRRRLDHMQQHSGQHLLSAVFAEETGARTVSFHLGESVSTIDLETADAKQQAAIVDAFARVEERVNRHIAENLRVAVRTVSAEEAQALLADGKLRKLPPREGSMRLIEIPGLDLNACGGTHVDALGQIGGLLLRGSERTRKALRVEFVCGPRAVASARQDFSALSQAASLLSVGRHDVPAATERVLAEAKATAKTQARLIEELAHHHAVQLAIEEHIEDGLRLVYRTFAERDGTYIRILASRLTAMVPQTAAIFVSTAQEPASLVLACSPSLGCSCGERLREALAALGLRGGGSPDMAQTQLPGAQAEQVAKTFATQLATQFRAVPQPK